MRCSSKCSHQLFGRFIAFFLTLKLLPVPASTAFGLYDSPLQWLQALIAFTIFLALKTALWALLIGSHAIWFFVGKFLHLCREFHTDRSLGGEFRSRGDYAKQQ